MIKHSIKRILVPVVITLICLAVFSVISGCDEPFPAYQQPENVLSVEVAITAKDTISVYYDDVYKKYYLDDPMIFSSSVTNEHINLLQGTARVNGVIHVQSFSQIPKLIEVTLNPADMRYPPTFQGNIALPPGNKAQFSTLWVPVAIDGKIIYEGLPYTLVGGIKLYGPISFTAVAEIQIFDRVQAIKSKPIEFKAYFRQMN
jgi:hypothetical protein